MRFAPSSTSDSRHFSILFATDSSLRDTSMFESMQRGDAVMVIGGGHIRDRADPRLEETDARTSVAKGREE
eukprot:6208482-Pleurochrysis_carterae.AAC.2